MKKQFKAITYPLLAIFLFTFVPALCCCMDLAEASETVGDHADAHAIQQRDSGHHDHEAHGHHGASSNESSHDHSQCEHPQLIGNLANPLAFYSGSAEVSFSKLTPEPGFIALPVIGTGKSHSPPHDLGPPGQYRFFNTPLYLQISVLLI